MATETPASNVRRPASAPSPARTAALMASYIALSSVVAVATDILLAWAFARVQAIAERRTAPCGCDDPVTLVDPETFAGLVDGLAEPYGEPHVRIVDVTPPPIGEQLQADNAGGEL